MKLAEKILSCTKKTEALEKPRLDIKTTGSKLIFSDATDQKLAKAILIKKGMKGIDKQKGKELEFADEETMEQALELVEADNVKVQKRAMDNIQSIINNLEAALGRTAKLFSDKFDIKAIKNATSLLADIEDSLMDIHMGFEEAKISEAEDTAKLDKMLKSLDAKLISSNKKHVLLEFPSDSKWMIYTNEIAKNKNIPGRPLLDISLSDAKSSEVEPMIKGMVK